ncbi:sugar O-acetyltransferase [Dethiosulfovibrio salsuginis]|uniref:sugar O-acetyltransferase n=1 Tax=Dethiosulfovibrio salsuginis TaxID=561720 RepID=UPI000A1CD2B7|nr:sugar O-acetyltransferase [Dethiosulfovibrio salsuginis]
MDQRERMLAGLPYKAWMDGLAEERLKARKLVQQFNTSEPKDFAKRTELIGRILGKVGKNAYIEPPFRCDYGSNIEIGDDFYANYNCIILDVAKVTIGNNVMLAPNVAIYTAGHPIHPDSRKSGYEYGIPITIGNNVWIGGNVVVNPGVSIGHNAVIGAGSVVTRDIPDNAIAVGNPCRVVRYITEEDRKYYFKDLEFDVEDYR